MPHDDKDEIDRLILELHATGGVPAPSTGDLARIERWLGLLSSRGGSDLLLVAGAPPSIRVDGRVLPLAEGPLDGVDIEDAVLPALPPHARRIYRDSRIVDASFRLSGVGRFRINLHRERGRGAAAVRLLPTRVPRLATLGLPPSVELLSQLPRGLVLIGGPTGSGKTTTLAALVDDVNRHLAQFEKIKKFAVIPAEFSVATGELTPTLKVKRRVVLDKYADVIEGLYA